MAYGTARAAASACLGLIALQAAGTSGGSGRIRQLLGDANTMVSRLLDPNVPAIPDLRNGGTWGATPATVSESAAAAARFHLPN